MDTTSLPYSSYSFMHAMQNGFYTPKKISDEAKTIYGLFRTDTTLVKYAAQMTFEGPKGFWEHEQYTMMNLRQGIQDLRSKKINVYGLYGKEDGLYSVTQIEKLTQLLGEGNLMYFDNCSHNVFIDQQNEFLKAMKNWGK